MFGAVKRNISGSVLHRQLLDAGFKEGSTPGKHIPSVNGVDQFLRRRQTSPTVKNQVVPIKSQAAPPKPPIKEDKTPKPQGISPSPKVWAEANTQLVPVEDEPTAPLTNPHALPELTTEVPDGNGVPGYGYLILPNGSIWTPDIDDAVKLSRALKGE